MEVTLPANTTATLFVPPAPPDSVMKSGMPASRAEGVKFLRVDGSAAVYEVGAGTFRFTVPSEKLSSVKMRELWLNLEGPNNLMVG